MLPNDAVCDWLAKHSKLATPAAKHGSQKYQPPHVEIEHAPKPTDIGREGFLANFASLLIQFN